VLLIESQRRRPGGVELEDRELPGLSDGSLRAGACVEGNDAGAEIRRNIMIARSVARLDCDSHPYQVVLDTGERLATKTIVIATGAQYKKPELANPGKFEGKGIYYGATYIESQWCEGEEVAVVGAAIRRAKPQCSSRKPRTTCRCWYGPGNCRALCRAI